MTAHRSLRLAGTAAIALIVATATCITSCTSQKTQAPGMGLANMQLSPAAAGSCEIDAVRMCQVIGGIAVSLPASSPSPHPATIPMASSNGPPSAPESLEFQIPMGQTIKLMCYYNPQHNSVYRADAAADAALTGNSVEYMKKQGFCVNK
jgi:hypothetical protein